MIARAVALSLILAGCSSEARDEAAAAALNAQLTSATIDGRAAPAKRTPDRLDAIPDAFRGRWGVAGDCGVTSSSVMMVGRDRLSRGTTDAVASYVLRAGATEMSIEFDRSQPPWLATTTLSRLPDGRLRRADPDGASVLYTLCAAR